MRNREEVVFANLKGGTPLVVFEIRARTYPIPGEEVLKATATILSPALDELVNFLYINGAPYGESKASVAFETARKSEFESEVPTTAITKPELSTSTTVSLK
jgi:hypothetical protein